MNNGQAKPASTRALFRATKPKPDKGPQLLADLPVQLPPAADIRDPLDYDPTPEDATAAFLAAEAQALWQHRPDRSGTTGLPRVWEPAVGGGHIARVLARHGFDVVGSDLVDRGHPGTILRSFYAWTGDPLAMAAAPARVAITNPPYGEVSARDGHGRWLLHSLGLGLDYIALLLNADWPAARKNGFDRLLAEHPPSVEYLCCWKIDFRGGGSPPQRNSWFVWDTQRPTLGPGRWIRQRLYRDGAALGQAGFDL